MKNIPRQNKLAGFFLFLLLFGVYALSYSGVPAADDEQLFAAAAINAAENGEMSAEQLYGNSRLMGALGGIEPFHSLAASWALRSGVFGAAGQMQALFWLNSLYTALTGVALFGLVLQFGGNWKQAVILCVVFGFGTLAWPYAKTFFREPLAMLLFTLAVYLSVLGTRNQSRLAFRVADPLGALVCYGAALLTKVLLLAVLPGLVWLVLWRIKEAGDKQKKAIWQAWGIALIVLAGLLLVAWTVLGWRLPERMSQEFFYQRYRNLMILPHEGFWAAMAGIFFSPGKGMFFYMPLLPVFVVGGFALRRRKPVLFWFPLVAVLGLVVAQALVYDADWWNMTWGTRFMVPVLPLMVLMGLPLLQWLEKQANRGWGIAFGGVCCLSMLIQLGGVLVTDPAYLEGLYEKTLQPVTELILWQVRHVPWLGHWGIVLQGGEIDLAVWRVFQQGTMRVLAVFGALVLLVAGCAFSLWRLAQDGESRRMWAAAGALGCAMLVMIGISMRMYRPDPAWHFGREDLAAAVELVEMAMQEEDGVVISPYLYPVWYYAMNEAQFGASWYSWPVPGDEDAADQALEGFLLLAEEYERVWLIEEGLEFPAGAQFREAFELVETRRFGEDVWVSVYAVE